MTTLAEALRKASWARSLDAKELALVQAEIIERRVPAGGYVCRNGEAVIHWVGVVDGLVKLGHVSPQGKVTTLAGVAAGGWFGESSLLKNQPRPHDAVAL